MNLSCVTIQAGLQRPVRLLHLSDTHLCFADDRDCQRKRDLAASRIRYFSGSNETLESYLDEAVAFAITSSVVGFGGYEVGAVVYPALTTVAFDYELVGMKAAQYMLDLLREEPVQENMEMPLFFVERESVRHLKREYEKEKPGSMNSLA